MAVHVIPARRAFCLLYKQMAEVINVEGGSFMTYDFPTWMELSDLKLELQEHDEHDDWVRSVNYRIQVPRVIRLVNYSKYPKQVVKLNRKNIFLRDENSCQYCGKHFGSQNLSLDHVVPRSRGGGMSWENIVCACLRCNVKKGGRTPREAGMKLRRKPFRPKRNPGFAHQLNSDKYACWRNFIDLGVESSHGKS